MPLSEFFFQELGKDIKLSTLDGKARLAERARPLLAQIPDGAFGDLMRQRLGQITGIGAPGQPTAAATPRPVRPRSNTPQKRSLVRSAIAFLLQKPALAMTLPPPYTFAELRQPGVGLLVELLELVRQRPDISTGALLEHFNEREEQSALQKLAAQALPGEEAAWIEELHDAIAQLEKQTLQQRIDELLAKQRQHGLDETDKYELRALLQARVEHR
jgi:DNA primase